MAARGGSLRVDFPPARPLRLRVMSNADPSSFRHGLVAALPIALGYVPIAFAFGVAATGQGLSGLEAFGLSAIIFSGAAQFLVLALIAGGAPILVAALTLVAMNIRHVLYGPALIKRAGPAATRRLAPLWAFALTDEVFGAALGDLARGRRFSEPFMLGLGLGAYLAWLGGTAMGAFAGGGALAGYPAVQASLAFMLPALFLALLLSILVRSQVPIIGIAALVCVALTLLGSGTAGILGGMIAGAVAGVVRPRGRHAR